MYFDSRDVCEPPRYRKPLRNPDLDAGLAGKLLRAALRAGLASSFSTLSSFMFEVVPLTNLFLVSVESADDVFPQAGRVVVREVHRHV